MAGDLLLRGKPASSRPFTENVGERPVASRIKRSHHELQTWRKP